MSLANKMNAEATDNNNEPKQKIFKSHIPKGVGYFIYKTLTPSFLEDGEYDIEWNGHKHDIFMELENYEDGLIEPTDFIGYSDPVGSSYGIHTNPSSGARCLFRSDLIVKIEYAYFQKWHKELGANWTFGKILEDENKGISHKGKIGCMLTIKLENQKEISLFQNKFRFISIKDNKIVICSQEDATIVVS